MRTFYRRYARCYDQQVAWYDRVLLGGGRAWELGVAAALLVADAQALPFAAAVSTAWCAPWA